MALKNLLVKVGVSTKGLNSSLRRAKNDFRREFGEIQSMTANVGRSMTSALTVPLLGIGAAAVKSAADLEKMETSFISLTGGAKQAADMMANLNEFTAKTPFQIEGVANAARQLIASGTEVSQVNDQLQFLGDIAATSGVSIEEIAAIFAKVNAKGKVELENLNQLAERGIPIFKALADATGLPADALGAGAVSVEEFNRTLSGFAQEGGFAAGAMERLSETAAGKFSTALDNLKLAGAELAQSLMPALKDILDGIVKLAQRFTGLSDETKKNILIVAGLLGAAGPIALAVGALMPIFAALTGPIGLVAAAVGALSYLIIDNFSVIEPAIVAVVNTIITFQNKTKALGVIFELVKGVIMGVVTTIQTAFLNTIDLITGLGSAAMAVMEGDFSKAADIMSGAFASMGQRTADAALDIGQGFMDGINDALNAEDIDLLEPDSISRFARKLKSDISGALSSGDTGPVDVPIQPRMQGMAARGVPAAAAATGGLLISADAAGATSSALTKMNEMVAVSVDLAGQASNAFVGLGQAIAGMATGTMNVGQFMASLLTQLADLLGQIGQQFIAAGIAAANFYANLIANPFAAVAAGIALVAASGIISTLGAKLAAEPPALAEGGLAFGRTLATVGDNPNAAIDPEVIAPLSKLRDMMGGNQVQVTGMLRGADILLTNERAQIDRNRLRSF